MVLLKAGTKVVTYLMEGLVITSSPSAWTGNFDIQFKNNKNEAELSHITLAGRLIEQINVVPEPMALSLIGGGLVAVAALRRRRHH